MSVFKNHRTNADRSASDRKRHKQKIDRAIKDGLKHIVAEESIIGQDGNKKIRIPVKGIKEYRFVYGMNENNKKVGSAKGKDVKRGQRLSKGNKKGKGQANGNKPGNKEGEERYSVEITLDELSSYLFENLKLPKMVDKKFKQIVDKKFKRSGYRSKGIRPRLSKKQTALQRIKRKKAVERNLRNQGQEIEDQERFPFNEKDLKYKHIKVTEKASNNAVVFFMMDVSGSMTKNKKFIARSFFFLLFQFLRYKYDKVEVVFISHTTTAKEVDEDRFFKRTSSGGTLLSSAPLLAKEIIYKRYHPSAWNIYAFHGSDGDNWENDIEKCIHITEELKKICQLYCFCEIDPVSSDSDWAFQNSSKMSKEYQYIVDEVFKTIFLTKSDDVWPAFEGIFSDERDYII